MAEHLTDDMGKAILLYCEFLLEEFFLTEWTVVIQDDPEKDQECQARVEADSGYLQVKLWVANNWMELHAEKQARILVHEMFHVVMFPYADTIEIAQKSRALSDQVMEMLWEHHRQVDETMCDRLTRHYMRTTDHTAEWRKFLRNAKKDKREVLPI